MSNRRQPTHPSKFTPAQLAAAKGERDKFRRDKAAGRTGQILAAHYGLGAPLSVPEARKSFQQHLIDRGPAVRTPVVSKIKPVATFAEHPVRANREVETEALTRDASRTRKRFRTPFTLPLEFAHRFVSELAARAARGLSQLELRPEDHTNEAFERRKQQALDAGAEPPLRKTRLDIALEDREQTALARYILDRSRELMGRKIADYGDGTGGTASWDRLPMNEPTRHALARLAHIHKHLSSEDRQDLNDFTRMLLPIDDADPMSPAELGHRIGKQKDSRVSEGVFVGAMRKIAQRLDILFRNYDPERLALAFATS
jgi:hypothetical protein